MRKQGKKQNATKMVTLIKTTLILVIIITLLFPYSIISNAEGSTSSDNIVILRSSYYKIDENNKIISIVEPETDINTFREKIVITASNNEKGEYEIYADETKKQVITTGIIKTGMVLHTSDADYPISVIGDINGDGKITQIDLSLLIRHIVGLKAYQLNGVKKISADISLDGKVDQRDLTKNIKCLVSGKLDIGEDKIKDTIAPYVTITEKEKTTNSISVKAEATDDVAMPEAPTYTFYIKQGNGSYTQEQSNTNTTFTATNLKANTAYTIKAETKDKEGNIGSKEITIKTNAMPSDSEVTAGAITFSEPTWSNGKASVVISTNTNYTIQYQVGSTTESWISANSSNSTGSSVTVNEINNNSVVYARLTDGVNNTENVQKEIKDTKGPIVTLTQGIVTTNSIEVTAGATDNETGMVNAPTYMLYIKESTASSYTSSSVQSSTSKTFTATNLKANTSYTIKAETKDIAGNTGSKEIIVKTNAMPGDSEITDGAITFGNVTWTSGKASITMSTSTDYTIEYQVNSDAGSWTAGTSVENLSSGNIVYARLTDGTNATGYTSITIADATAPTGNIELDKLAVNPGETITATVTATDGQSGVNLSNCKWVMNTSNEKLGTDETKYTGGNLASDGTASITTSSTEGTYYLHVLLKDNAGNKKEIVSNNIEVATTTFNYTADKMVEYDAGEWTKAEINTLKGLDLYNINIARSSSPAFTFGGFTYKGDTTNASNISNGTITTNRNKSIAPQSGCGTPTSDGWEVLEWGNIDGNKRYVKKLIHAGSPENFVFNYNSSSNSGLEAEYVLGGERETKYATYQPRSFDMYKDKTKENMIKEVHAMTLEEFNATTNKIKTIGAYYFLASNYISNYDDKRKNLYFVDNNGYSNFVGWWGTDTLEGDTDKTPLGIRPVIVLNDGVYVDISKHDGSGSDKYVLEKDEMPTDEQIQEGAITFSEPTWTVGKASITMSTSTNYTIEYQVNSITENWVAGTTAENLVDGDILYARLTDGTNATGYTTITIKLPENTTIMKTSDGTAKTIEIYGNKVKVTENGTTSTATIDTTIDPSNGDYDENSKNILSKVYGTAVEYTGNTDINAKTWRIFYIDFANKYGDGEGTVYLKADWIANGTILSGQSSYTPTDADKTIIENMNKKWYTARGTATWNANEHEAAWLCSPSQWTKYKNSVANYAIGSPSIEIYCDSYNSVNHSTGNHKITCQYQTNTCPGYDTDDSNIIDTTDYNAMYGKAYVDCWQWLASPSSYRYDGLIWTIYCGDNFTWLKRGDAGGGTDSSIMSFGICPLVSLPSNNQLNIK